MEHQDWNEVVWSKKGVEKRATNPKSIPKKSENSTKIPDKFTKEFIQEVINKRLAKEMNRKKFAEAIGETLQKIDWFETGKDTYSGEFVSKLKRLFGKFENDPRQISGKLEE